MPWKENNNNNGPWGEPNGGGDKPSKKKQSINFDTYFANLKDQIKKIFPGGGSNKRNVLFACLIFFILWLLTGFYKVNANEQGVVLRFGEWVRTTLPGLHYHLPYPIEIAKTPKVTKVNKTEIGFRVIGTSQRMLLEESLMLTGDENIVDINFSVFWIIDDAGKFLFKLRNPEKSVKSVSESVMREVIGITPIVDALAAGRQEIEILSLSKIQNVLDNYESGVKITQLQLQKVDPPDQVIDSFRDVQRARADKEKVINEAIAYKNDLIPRARGEAEQILQEAEAYKREIVARSEGDADRFNSVLKAYKNNEDVTRNRIYLETLEKIFQNATKVIIDTKQGSGVLPYLPLPEVQKRNKRKKNKLQNLENNNLENNNLENNQKTKNVE